MAGRRKPIVSEKTNLKALRTGKGLSQTDLADRIGTTLNMYGKLERGDRRLNMDWLRRIASALDVGIDAIVAEVEPDEPASSQAGSPAPSFEAMKAMLSEHYRSVMNQDMAEEMLNDLAERVLDSVENWKDDPAAARDPQVARSVARQINRRFSH